MCIFLLLFLESSLAVGVAVAGTRISFFNEVGCLGNETGMARQTVRC